MCTQPAQNVIIDDISLQKVVGVSISIRERNLSDFTDYIVRNDNSSVHMLGSYGPYERSKLQPMLIDS